MKTLVHFIENLLADTLKWTLPSANDQTEVTDGFSDFLQKPKLSGEIVERLKQLLKKSKN